MMEIWSRTGFERGVLGYPVSDSFPGGDRIGQKQLFAGGALYWKLGRGAAVYGKINEKYNEMGAETSWLGYPVADEVGLPDGVGRMSRFEHGWIYWHPQHGAHPVGMDMFSQWEAHGYELGSWGYPTSDPVMDSEGAYETRDFQGGKKSGLPPSLWIIVRHSNRDIISEIISRSRTYAHKNDIEVKQVIKLNALEIVNQAALSQLETIELKQMGYQNAPMDYEWNEPPRVAKTAVIGSGKIHRKGDIYYNWAGRFSENNIVRVEPGGVHLNYSHVGLFTGTEEIVEAVGVTSTTTKFYKDNTPYRFKVRRFHPGNSISEKHIDAATTYASSAAHRHAPYDVNPFTNKSDGDDFEMNCSELVWRSYMSLGGWVDLDSNGGPGVWPRDVRDSGHLVEYK